MKLHDLQPAKGAMPLAANGAIPFRKWNRVGSPLPRVPPVPPP